MRYHFSLREGKFPQTEVKRQTVKLREALSDREIKDRLDKLYFRYIEDEMLDRYPAVIVKVIHGGKIRTFTRIEGSPATGFSDLWQEQK